METREIVVKDTKSQKVTRIQTAATNVAELMQAMKTAGIDYSGMTITEGITKTTFLDPSSPLPQNVMFKGRQTNSLFILLTNTQKNIASGAGDRKEAYRLIKQHGLQDTIKAQYGRNFTQVPTDKLFEYINMRLGIAPIAPEEPKIVEPKKEVADVTEEPMEIKGETGYKPSISKMTESLYILIKATAEETKCTAQDLETLADLTSDLAKQMKESMVLSDSEIEELANIEI